ncbi:MAG: UTP--glucose-1-phosphate uridylyltransferase [Candidatus Bathyarchaeia archaeon]
MIVKAVIPVAGLGTRLTPATKEQPKEMLPVFAPGPGGQTCLKPLVQIIFESLYDFGFREFCFIIGRGKRAIEDHFTQDYNYIGMLKGKGKNAADLESFYERLERSKIIWVNQPEPKGFGEAVLRAAPFIGGEKFLVHAGDTYIISDGNDHLRRLVGEYERLRADAMLLLQEVEDPREYGVAEVGGEDGVSMKVLNLIEKPEEPPTNLAVMPLYIFDPVILKALERTGPGKGGEIQLTDAIQTLIGWGLRVYATKLESKDVRLDIGNPEIYWESLRISHNHASKRPAM